ncbi:hypothetical protein [Maricaulis sp. CAU 1757]
MKWLARHHQVITAVGAMLVGLAALFVAWDQARVMRAQQHGAVYPALQVDGFITTREGEISFGVRVANSGVGPAIVEEVRVLRDGAEADDLSQLFAVLPDGYSQSWSSMNGRIIAPGDEVIPIEVDLDPASLTPAERQAFQAEWRRWSVEFCYCSVFDRCWRNATSWTERPRPVGRCERPEQDLFENLGIAPQPGEETPQ